MIIYDVGYYWLVFLVFILIRYFLLAGGTFWLLYPVSKVPFIAHPISRAPKWELIRQDIVLSVTSAFLFALFAALIMSIYKTGGTQLYSSISEYGWGYSVFSFGAILVLQDTYFYFIHRLLHHPWLFKHIHRGHHRSHIPTPWTSFAFEPIEAIIHSLFFVGLVFVMPLHYAVLIAVFITMTLWAIITHLGFELVPPSSARSWLGYGLIGPLHHTIHHRQYQVHFGLYFTFWDHLLGTTDPAYSEKCTPSRNS